MYLFINDNPLAINFFENFSIDKGIINSLFTYFLVIILSVLFVIFLK